MAWWCFFFVKKKRARTSNRHGLGRMDRGRAESWRWLTPKAIVDLEWLFPTRYDCFGHRMTILGSFLLQYSL